VSVPTGYKATEVGVIPENWDAKPLKLLNPFITSGSRGWAKYYADVGDAFVRITNLSRQNIYPDMADLRRVKLPAGENEGTRTGLRNGDVLVSITADIGIIGYVDDRVPKPAYINQHIAIVRVDPNDADSKFLSYFLATEGSQRRVRATTDAGAKAGMSLSGVGNLLVACPPTVSEQAAIAKALSDMDEAIAAVEAVIAKKYALKTATMQAILSGTRRLPGFSGEWQVKALDKICPMQRGFDLPTRQIRAGNVPVVYSNGISAYHNKAMVKAPGIITGRSGTIGNVHYVDQDFWPHNTSLWVTSFCGNDPKFILYFLRKLGLAQFASGSGVPTLNRNDLHSFRVKIPEPEEQIAIAAVLSDIDVDLSATDAKLAKLCRLKTGMMQQLLTGKIRMI
jgi:type I restriction enzyme S subunit